MPDTPVTYDDAECLDLDGLGLTVRIGNERVFVGKYVPMAGTTIRAKGDRGTLMLPRWFVEQQGLPFDKHLSDQAVEAWLASARLRAAAADEHFTAHPDDKEAEAELNRATEALSAAMLLRARRQRPR
jgi:hypothetical protein